jgi:hypothetical protein
MNASVQQRGKTASAKVYVEILMDFFFPLIIPKIRFSL